MATIPDVISRYYAAAASRDLDTLIGCFTTDAHVLDGGSTRVVLGGRDHGVLG